MTSNEIIYLIFINNSDKKSIYTLFDIQPISRIF